MLDPHVLLSLYFITPTNHLAHFQQPHNRYKRPIGQRPLATTETTELPLKNKTRSSKSSYPDKTAVSLPPPPHAADL